MRKYRPGLQITVLDAAPTGLVMVSGLDPKSRVLDQASTKIVAQYRDITLDKFGLNAFGALFDDADTAAFAAAGYPLFDAVKLPEAAALKPEKVTP